jgi:hypothetical protein
MIRFLQTIESGETRVEVSGHQNAEIIKNYTIIFLLYEIISTLTIQCNTLNKS